MFFLQDYDSDCEENGQCASTDEKSLENEKLAKSKEDVVPKLINTETVNSAPYIDDTICCTVSKNYVDSSVKEIFHNPTYEELYAKSVGPENPFKVNDLTHSNTYTGHIEETFMHHAVFEGERQKYHNYGASHNPAADGVEMLGDVEKLKEADSIEKSNKKRKRFSNKDSADVDGYLGPWATYVDEERVSKPSAELQKELDEYQRKRQQKTGRYKKRSVVADPANGVESEEAPAFQDKSTLHISEVLDYQGRSFLHPPHDINVNLKNTPNKCYQPKSLAHTWSDAHGKGVAAIRLFPNSAHLLLSAGLDSKVKIWEVYKERRLIRSYMGHREAVRDIDFNYCGEKFLSASYDRHIKEWDTETGKCLGRFNCRKVPYCVRYNPDANKSNLFVVGTASKKILCWDTRSGEIVQEYDRHLGAVNSITFVDNNRRFVSTSDDKSLRVWEWDIPVDMKYIADPTMHSIPSVTLAPNGKWLACQSMDNKISIFSALNRYKLNSKKKFTGHMVAGYSCSVDFSPDMSFLISGDADGKCFIWDWKSTQLLKKWKAHDAVCVSSLWHPHETNKVITASWDSTIKIWH